MFKKTQEYQDIKKELTIVGLLNEAVSFASFSDGIFTFNHEKDGTLNSFDIVAINPIFTNETTISDLLEADNITYFSHSIFYVEREKNITSFQPLICKRWSFNEISGLI